MCRTSNSVGLQRVGASTQSMKPCQTSVGASKLADTLSSTPDREEQIRRTQGMRLTPSKEEVLCRNREIL